MADLHPATAEITFTPGLDLPGGAEQIGEVRYMDRPIRTGFHGEDPEAVRAVILEDISHQCYWLDLWAAWHAGEVA